MAIRAHIPLCHSVMMVLLMPMSNPNMVVARRIITSYYQIPDYRGSRQACEVAAQVFSQVEERPLLQSSANSWVVSKGRIDCASHGKRTQRILIKWRQHLDRTSADGCSSMPFCIKRRIWAQSLGLFSKFPPHSMPCFIKHLS